MIKQAVLSKSYYRFGIVGVINTLTDLAVYTLLLFIGFAPFWANIPSTTAGMIVSFTLNKSFTFNDRFRGRNQIIRFLIVTLIGLWMIQPLVIYSVINLSGGDSSTFISLVAKIIATAVSLCWNYYWYKNFVFKDRADQALPFLGYIRNFIKTDIGVCLLIAVLWQTGMLLFGIVIERILQSVNNPLIDAPGFSPLSHTLRWDGNWFMGIVNGSYGSTDSSPVFYPLFPLLITIIRGVTFGVFSELFIGFALNTVCIWAAILFLSRIVKLLVGNRYKWYAVALFLAYPAALFMHMFYSEALFCALAFAAYYYALRRSWLTMAILLGLLSAVRLPAILIIALCFFEFCRSYQWNLKRILNLRLLYFALAPAGLITYSFYLHVVRGDFLSMFHSYKLWTFHVFNPNFVETYIRAAHTFLLGLTPTNNHEPMSLFVNIMLPVVMLAILAITSLFAVIRIRSWGIPLGLSGLLSFIMFTLNSNINSVHRYILPSLVIYLVCAFLIKTYRWTSFLAIGAIGASLMVQTLLLVLFVNSYFAG